MREEEKRQKTFGSFNWEGQGVERESWGVGRGGKIRHDSRTRHDMT